MNVRYDFESGLLADALNAGYVVGRIAHERLDVDIFTRRHAVVFLELFGSVYYILFCLYEYYRRVLGYELERVPVTGQRV